MDYVAMDVKASREKYERTVGVPSVDLSRLDRSISLLMGQDKIPYEFRTTVAKGLHDLEDIEAIGKWLAGARVLFLQGYRESENVLDPSLGMGSYELTELECMAEKARKYIARVEVRGVE